MTGARRMKSRGGSRSRTADCCERLALMGAESDRAARARRMRRLQQPRQTGRAHHDGNTASQTSKLHVIQGSPVECCRSVERIYRARIHTETRDRTEDPERAPHESAKCLKYELQTIARFSTNMPLPPTSGRGRTITSNLPWIFKLHTPITDLPRNTRAGWRIAARRFSGSTSSTLALRRRDC